MGIFTWMKRLANRGSTSKEPHADTLLSGARESMAPELKARRRAMRLIGCPDVAPPPPSFRERAIEKEAEAIANGAIAGVWGSSKYYDPHGGIDHPERDQKIYLVRDSWAEQKKLVQPGPDGYLDEITGPCEELGCQCSVSYVFGVSRLPINMLTPHGRNVRDQTKQKVAELEKISRKTPTLQVIRSYSAVKERQDED